MALIALEMFPRDSSKKSGRSSACGKCRAKHKAARYAAGGAWVDREREKARQRARAIPTATNRARVKDWKKRNPDATNEMHRRERKGLPEYYVIRLLRGNSCVPGVQYPQALIDAKRLQVAIHRIVKEMENK
jgi:hypothetical protein